MSDACAGCGSSLVPEALVCARCHALVHAGRLKELARESAAKEEEGALSAALEGYRSMLDLLPEGTRQREQIRARVLALSARVDQGGEAPAPPKKTHRKGALGAAVSFVGLLLFKLKSVILYVFAFGKPLLLGLTKMSTLLSMALTVGLYATLFGAKFALGLVLAIYVHELGHVVTLKKFGIAASAPMFIPGFGALVRLRQVPESPVEDARIGLAGPRWGLAASMVAAMAGFVLHAPVLLAVARVSAWINIFNLLPFGSLDGGRGFRAMSKRGRWIACLALLVTWLVTKDGVVMLILLGAVIRTTASEAPADNDWHAVVEYAGLSLALGLVMALVPSPHR